MPVLTGIDVQGVQRYVFASNRLRDAVASSWLVHWATGTQGALEASSGDVLLASGGNATLRFAKEQLAKDFVTRLTRELHEKAPGLEVVVAHRPYAEGELAAALRLLQTDLAKSKLERRPSAPQLGLSVTARCRVSGLPATAEDEADPGTLLSAMVSRWRQQGVRKEAKARWDHFLDTKQFEFPAELDDMGRTRGDTSLIGVVHIDGNSIGERIREWLAAAVHQGRSDDDVQKELGTWSSALDDVGRRALRAVCDRVMGAIDTEKASIKGAVPNLGFDLRRSEGQQIFVPLRPVLLGGDDLTFLCDGRIALDLAQTALDCFTGDLPSLGSISACAGVAVVAAHSPFDRAYDLAEALCGNAKARRRERGDAGNWIDWHVGDPRPGEGIAGMRKRAYSQPIGQVALELTCRPYRVGSDLDETETWRWLAGTVLGTGPAGFRGAWAQHRNKVKELLSLVREGPDGVGRARGGWTAADGLRWPAAIDETNGFLGAVRTPLLDAIELLDIHLPLSAEPES